jgi:hypothetical protein
MRSILSFLFSFYDEYECFPMLISYDCVVWLLKWTLSYYSNQSIANFTIKTRVWYLTYEANKFNNYDGSILLILEKTFN